MAAKKNTPTAYAGSEPYIFVSYAHKDSDKAFPFIAALQNHGSNVWFDDGILPGNEWAEDIAQKLAGCTVFLFLVYGISLESDNCKDELDYARRNHKKFVNVLIEDIRVFPRGFDLRYMRYQDCRLFNYDSYDEAVEDLSKKVREMELTRSSGNPPVGSFVEFGSYPQSTKGEIAPIEWLVLKNDGKKALLISRYCLDAKPYNEELTDVTWGTCSLREWLNRIFVNEAFTEDEQNLIRRETVTADKNPNWSTSPGNNTNDEVFLLSIPEVKKYFRSTYTRKCAPTEYAIAQGAGTSDTNKTGGRAACWWWLRSPGDSSDDAAIVRDAGSVEFRGERVDFDRFAVRPALWINLES